MERTEIIENFKTQGEKLEDQIEQLNPANEKDFLMCQKQLSFALEQLTICDADEMESSIESCEKAIKRLEDVKRQSIESRVNSDHSVDEFQQLELQNLKIAKENGVRAKWGLNEKQLHPTKQDLLEILDQGNDFVDEFLAVQNEDGQEVNRRYEPLLRQLKIERGFIDERKVEMEGVLNDFRTQVVRLKVAPVRQEKDADGLPQISNQYRTWCLSVQQMQRAISAKWQALEAFEKNSKPTGEGVWYKRGIKRLRDEVSNLMAQHDIPEAKPESASSKFPGLIT